MSNYSELAAELCTVSTTDRAQVRAEITTLLHFGGGLTIDSGLLHLSSEPISDGAAERLSHLLRRFYGVHATVIDEIDRLRRARVEVAPKSARVLAAQLGLITPGGYPVVGLPPRLVAEGSRNTLVATAALRGAILAAGNYTGSIQRGPALAIVCPSLPAAMAIRAQARYAGAPGVLRTSRGEQHTLAIRHRHGLRGVLIEMGAAVFVAENIDPYLEAARSQRAQVLSVSNRDRILRASTVSCDRIRSALELLGDELPPELKVVAQARIEHPEESLTEIGARCGVNKNVVSGRLRRVLKSAARPQPIRQPA
jgi:DNA-binding protein WhiA